MSPSGLYSGPPESRLIMKSDAILPFLPTSFVSFVLRNSRGINSCATRLTEDKGSAIGETATRLSEDNGSAIVEGETVSWRFFAVTSAYDGATLQLFSEVHWFVVHLIFFFYKKGVLYSWFQFFVSKNYYV